VIEVHPAGNLCRQENIGLWILEVKISNSKKQISNKSQNAMFNDQNCSKAKHLPFFRYWSLDFV